jgi:hypothetical protein
MVGSLGLGEVYLLRANFPKDILLVTRDEAWSMIIRAELNGSSQKNPNPCRSPEIDSFVEQRDRGNLFYSICVQHQIEPWVELRVGQTLPAISC